MKKLGLNGFHDLDEVMASPKAEWKRPWWVRSVDRPTVQIDWDRIERFDARRHLVPNLKQYTGDTEFQRLEELRKENCNKWILDGRRGYTLRDYALSMAVRTGAVDSSFIGHWQNAGGSGHGWQMFSPEELGVPRWEARPEENSRMIRAFARFAGASQVGFLELDEHTRKLIYAFDEIDGKKLEFEDVDKAYETKDKRVLPNKAAWIIVFSVQMSRETMKRTTGAAPTPISVAATYQAYARSRFIIDQLQTFLHMIGYQGLMGPSWNALGIAPALGVMAGLGELSRLNRMVTPEYGPMQRIFKMVTDLPLAPTRPIDAGIMRFCRTCKICANACPTKTLSMDTEPSWEVKGLWNNPGLRAYYDNSPKCAAYWWKSTVSCSTCISSCPFGKQDGSFIHQVVAATIAGTPTLNGFFTRVSGVLDTNRPKDPDTWWNQNLPPNRVK
jgi:epoxyqueuosine reductase